MGACEGSYFWGFMGHCSAICPGPFACSLLAWGRQGERGREERKTERNEAKEGRKAGKRRNEEDKERATELEQARQKERVITSRTPLMV